MNETEGTFTDLTADIEATWQSPPNRCSYLPHETASLVYRQIFATTADRYEALLARGWRRHGAMFFRPACPHCRQCRSLRVDVAKFRASKSQRRCWRRNADVSVALTRPGLSRQHLDLFNRYHADMHQRRGWPLHETDAADYATSFLLGNFDFAYELRFARADELIGVGLVDITPRCASSVYFYHDPAWRAARPGVFSLLAELRVAAQLGLQHHYLGYWIAACGSMAYKSQYRPHELLEEFVADNQVPLWTDGDAALDT